VIVLGEEGYSMQGQKYFCGACMEKMMEAEGL